MSPKIRTVFNGMALIFLIGSWVVAPSGGLADHAQRIINFAFFGAVVLLFGIETIPIKWMAAWFFSLLAMLFGHSTYFHVQLVGFAGILILGIAAHLGSKLRQESNQLVWFLFAIIIASSINSIEGLLQWTGLGDELWQWMYLPERRGIAYGIFRQPNLYATFLNVGIICMLWVVHLRKLTEGMAWIILTLHILGVATSGSRTGMLEIILLAATGIWLFSYQRKIISRLMLGSIFLLALSLLLLPEIAKLHGFGFVSSFERVARSTQDPRWIIWHNTLEMIWQRPWIGWGWQEFGFGYYSTKFDYKTSEVMDNAHNLPLQIAAEFGIPIALLFVISIIWAVYCGRPWYRVKLKFSTDDKFESQRIYAWLILIDIVGLHSMLEYPLWNIGFLFLTGVALGYLLPVATQFFNRKLEHKFIKATALILIVTALYSWGQYEDVKNVGKTNFNDKEAQRTSLKYGEHAWLFAGYVELNQLILDLDSKNSLEVRHRTEKLLHFSTEPLVIRLLLISLWHLNDVQSFQYHATHFCEKFPIAFEHWNKEYIDHPMTKLVKIQPEKCDIFSD